ncbi:hypothetical protein KIPB_002239 [Kipferlia bialata]|uniref:Uncharacterized protein n=1 Tax=Kipferlia bialata TaxID=797122 RepID=A0A9K3GFU0_9EUKA|nr:hypothetical protein KIPB_002239 [Kipferlia bialata]|eukprot:g2239.t1
MPNVTRYWNSTEGVMEKLSRYGFQCQCPLCRLDKWGQMAHDAASVTYQEYKQEMGRLTERREYTDIIRVCKKSITHAEALYATEHYIVEDDHKRILESLAMCRRLREYREYCHRLIRFLEGIVPGYPMISTYKDTINHPRRMLDADQMPPWDAWWAKEGKAEWEALVAEETVAQRV